MSLHRKLNVKIFLMFIVAENTGSVNIGKYLPQFSYASLQANAMGLNGKTCDKFSFAILILLITDWDIQLIDNLYKSIISFNAIN